MGVRCFFEVWTMMVLSTTSEPMVRINYKPRNGVVYAEAIFNDSAVALIDALHPSRTHIDVYIDVELNQLGFKTIDVVGEEPKHYKSVSVTKVVRKLKTGKYDGKPKVKIKYSTELKMWVAQF